MPLANIPEGKKADRADLDIRRSKGQNRTGIPVFYIRPVFACDNRSHRFIGYDKMEKGIAKWFSPEIRAYIVDGHLIGSNTPNNARREYNRICERKKIGQTFEVKPLQP